MSGHRVVVHANAPPDAEFRRFDLAHAYSGMPPMVEPAPGGRYRWILVGLGLGVAIVAAAVAGWTAHGTPFLRWSPFLDLDVVGIMLGIGAAFYFARTPGERRTAQWLDLSSRGLSVRFSDGSIERIEWGDPELDAGIGEGVGLSRAPDRRLIGLWGLGWRTPALITPEARDAVRSGAARQGIREELVREEVGGRSRETVYWHPPSGPRSSIDQR